MNMTIMRVQMDAFVELEYGVSDWVYGKCIKNVCIYEDEATSRNR